MLRASRDDNKESLRIDSHQHFWRYDPAIHTFINDRMPVLKQDYLPGHLKAELNEVGICGCVAVQAPQTMEETRWLLDLSDTHDFIRAVVGWADLRSPAIDSLLEELASHPKLRGIRHIIQDEPDAIFHDGSFRRGVSLLSRHALSYDMLIREHQLPLAREFMASLPDVTFVLDHIGKPNLRDPNVNTFSEALRPIADLPHVVCKLSGLVTEADWETWTPELIGPYLDVAVGMFGTERLLFGSDWPVCLLAGSYQDVFRVVDDYFRNFSESERAGIFGENARRTYRVPR